MTTSPRIVCLLPARNAAGLLPAFFEAAPACCDAIVALDDGSTDETGAALAAEPLVELVLTNRRRDGYLGWHDGLNRNRLLAAAEEAHPDWILWLDADERMDTSDAEALRAFVAGEAIETCAFGFRVFRMLTDEHYDPRFDIAYRLFRFHPGQRLSMRRLDFAPVPTGIEPRAWVDTTLRIMHYGEIDDAGRDARVAKLQEADPEGSFRDFYGERLRPLGDPPHPLWTPRDPHLPVLDQPGLESLDLDGPVLSVVVIVAQGDEQAAAALLSDLAGQHVAEPVEVLVVGVGCDPEPLVRPWFPEGHALHALRGSRPGRIRNRALELARGDYVVILEVPVTVAHDALAQVMEAHERGHAVVLGSGSDGSTASAPNAASFARELLVRSGGFDEHARVAVDAIAAHDLASNGHTTAHAGFVTSAAESPRRQDLRQRFELGRSIGRHRARRDLPRRVRSAADLATVAGAWFEMTTSRGRAVLKRK